MYVGDATTFKQTPCSCTLIENSLLSCFSLSLFFFFSQFHKLYQSSHLTILYILKDKLSLWQQSSGKSKLKYREIRSKMTVFIARVANMVKKKKWVFQGWTLWIAMSHLQTVYLQMTRAIFKCLKIEYSFAWQYWNCNTLRINSC